MTARVGESGQRARAAPSSAGVARVGALGIFFLSAMGCADRAELIDSGDAAAEGGDAELSRGCDGTTECSDGIDHDGDGFADMDDPQCASCYDDNEAGFSPEIPGHSPSEVVQGCFFVGHRGESERPCRIPTCCYDETLDETPEGDPCGPDRDVCAEALSGECAEICGPATPPGCDCAGCCTVCSICERNEEGEPIDPECDPGERDCIQLWRGADFGAYPDCDPTDLREEDCPMCEPHEGCRGAACEDEACVRCAGQTEAEVPDACTPEERCPGGVFCEGDTDCARGEYCALGCCLERLE